MANAPSIIEHRGCCSSPAQKHLAAWMMVALSVATIVCVGGLGLAGLLQSHGVVSLSHLPALNAAVGTIGHQAAFWTMAVGGGALGSGLLIGSIYVMPKTCTTTGSLLPTKSDNNTPSFFQHSTLSFTASSTVPSSSDLFGNNFTQHSVDQATFNDLQPKEYTFCRLSSGQYVVVRRTDANHLEISTTSQGFREAQALTKTMRKLYSFNPYPQGKA